MEFSRWFGGLPIDLYVATADTLRRQRPGFIEANAPQPLVQTHGLKGGWESGDGEREGNVRRAQRIQGGESPG